MHAHRDAAAVEEDGEHWKQAEAYRAHVFEILAPMKPDSYTDQRSGLV